jgi:hypothetical protein
MERLLHVGYPLPFLDLVFAPVCEGVWFGEAMGLGMHARECVCVAESFVARLKSPAAGLACLRS